MGDTITITCSSDLDAIAVQWYYNSQLIVNSPGSQADLVFSPVNDSIHNTAYLCSVLTSSCSSGVATIVIVQGISISCQFYQHTTSATMVHLTAINDYFSHATCI